MVQLFLENRILNGGADLRSTTCPNCGHKALARIKRKNFHRFLSIVLAASDLKRYACERCDWKGLKFIPVVN